MSLGKCQKKMYRGKKFYGEEGTEGVRIRMRTGDTRTCCGPRKTRMAA